jgi:FlaA1/EpsC-like NDP-sugar epimerase
MVGARSWIRIAVNVALDGGLAALSVPVARWLADPAAPALHPLWTIPLGAACLLIAGLPFRLSLQYWRFAAIGDVMTVAASAAAGAALFAAATALTTGAPPNPALPAIHALTLLVFLGTPRAYYRWRRGRPAVKPAHLDAASILLVGSIEDADLFIRALSQDRRQAFRVEGLLASSDRQTGRRIQGHRILG